MARNQNPDEVATTDALAQLAVYNAILKPIQ